MQSQWKGKNNCLSFSEKVNALFIFLYDFHYYFEKPAEDMLYSKSCKKHMPIVKSSLDVVAIMLMQMTF